jgi:hypothetical protein
LSSSNSDETTRFLQKMFVVLPPTKRKVTAEAEAAAAAAAVES